MLRKQTVSNNSFSSANLPSYLPLRLVSVRKTTEVLDALGDSPSLGSLVARAQDSQECLHLVAPLIPPSMRASIAAGAFEEGAWCLVVSNNAIAAKLRQFLPALLAHLRSKGKTVQSIRIKIAGS